MENCALQKKSFLPFVEHTHTHTTMRPIWGKFVNHVRPHVLLDIYGIFAYSFECLPKHLSYISPFFIAAPLLSIPCGDYFWEWNYCSIRGTFEEEVIIEVDIGAHTVKYYVHFSLCTRERKRKHFGIFLTHRRSAKFNLIALFW